MLRGELHGDDGDSLTLNLRGNPIEIASLFAMLVATIFVAMIGFRSEKLRANLPALEKIDSLIHKTVGVAFAGLQAILLVTGAVWANESWGRYRGWDSKEDQAGWWLGSLTRAICTPASPTDGRDGDAYFALVGFLLVIFTYLGIATLLPGLPFPTQNSDGKGGKIKSYADSDFCPWEV